VAIVDTTTCTLTVTDQSGSPSTPTGQVSLSAQGPGDVDGSPCTLSGTDASSASCSATFSPSGPVTGGDVTVLGTYMGQGVYLVSSGSTSIKVKAILKGACAGRAATMLGRAGSDRMRGTRSSDVIVSGPGNDRIGPGAGTDLVCAGPGNDTINGGPGNDVAYGGPGNDAVNGGAGNDVGYGGPGNDAVSGGAGNDAAYGGPGTDSVKGGAGNDMVFARDGRRDVIDCGPGRDIATVDPIDRTRHCEIVGRRR